MLVACRGLTLSPAVKDLTPATPGFLKKHLAGEAIASERKSGTWDPDVRTVQADVELLCELGILGPEFHELTAKLHLLVNYKSHGALLADASAEDNAKAAVMGILGERKEGGDCEASGSSAGVGILALRAQSPQVLRLLRGLQTRSRVQVCCRQL